jgi:hypothetical protein
MNLGGSDMGGMSQGGADAMGGMAGMGGADSGSCTPGPVPVGDAQYDRSAFRAQWSVPCDFVMYGGCEDAMPPEKAFDGDGATRTSIGNTHFESGAETSQNIGDAFIFDMQECKELHRLVMFAAAPPNNQGSYDARDFPGAVDVTVASDCMTAEDGTISGEFGEVVATAVEPQPGCQDDGNPCDMPMVIEFSEPMPARCVRIELTEILELGGGIWWAIDELQVY